MAVVGSRQAMAESRLGMDVVIVTRDRRASLLRTLDHLVALPEQPHIIVVDNASGDGTESAVRAAYPDVEVVRLAFNAGAAGRTVGVTCSRARYVAFADDDSWWAPGALAAAVEVLDEAPTLAVLVARLLVGRQNRLDPVCEQLADSPLGVCRGAPARAVAGFPACAAVVRRQPFLDVGGFHPKYGVGGEEELLALDLMAAGWELGYVDQVVAHHHPASEERAGRGRRQVRNALWTTWLRRSPPAVARETTSLLLAGLRDPQARHGVIDALVGLPWVLGERRQVPAAVEEASEVCARSG